MIQLGECLLIWESFVSSSIGLPQVCRWHFKAKIVHITLLWTNSGSDGSIKWKRLSSSKCAFTRCEKCPTPFSRLQFLSTGNWDRVGTFHFLTILVLASELVLIWTQCTLLLKSYYSIWFALYKIVKWFCCSLSFSTWVLDPVSSQIVNSVQCSVCGILSLIPEYSLELIIVNSYTVVHSSLSLETPVCAGAASSLLSQRDWRVQSLWEYILVRLYVREGSSRRAEFLFEVSFPNLVFFNSELDLPVDSI